MTAFDEAKRCAWAGSAFAYEQTFARLCAHTVDALLDAANAGSGVRVLDVGTGAGAVAARALARGALVAALDPDPDMRDMARQSAPGARVFGAALPLLPFRAGSFDAVVANFVLNHVGDPRAAVMEMVRVARPGGWVSATVWPRPLTPLHQLWEDVIELSGALRPSTAVVLAPDIDFDRTVAGLAEMLRGEHLVDVEAQTFSFTHIVDPDSWWSGPARGVASMGAVVTSQSPQMIQVMRSCYDELSGRYLGADRMLHLPAAAVLASGRVPNGGSLLPSLPSHMTTVTLPPRR